MKCDKIHASILIVCIYCKIYFLSCMYVKKMYPNYAK